MSAYREWRERVAKAWHDEQHDVMGTNLWRALANQPLMPPEVLELQRRYEEDTEQFWDIRQAGDQVAIDRNDEYHDDVARAAHRYGIHDLCSHHVNYEPPDDNEYMSSRGYAGKPVGQVWGTVNPDGSVTARGFRDDESYSDDSAVHPAGQLAAYNAETDAWVHMATGQTVAKQREIDEQRERRRDDRMRILPRPADASDGKFDPPPVALPWTPKGADVNGVKEARRPADGPCTCPPDPINETEQCKSCTDDFNRRYCEPDGWKDDEERIANGDAPVNQAAAGAVEGVSKITPTGLATTALSGATGKDIKSPLATAAGSTSSGGGSGVSDAEQGNAKIQQAGQDIEAAMGAIQEIITKLETAQQHVTAAAENSQHSEADTAMGALQQAVTAASDLQQQVGAAKQAVEDVRL